MKFNPGDKVIILSDSFRDGAVWRDCQEKGQPYAYISSRPIVEGMPDHIRVVDYKGGDWGDWILIKDLKFYLDEKIEKVLELL